MPANSLFDMDHPSNPTVTMAPPGVADERALQLALELSMLGINPDGVGHHASDADFVGQMTEAERSRRSQNMTECVGVPSSEHVAEIVGRQGCKIKALRTKTNTYIKTPVRGEEPVFVVTGRKEDVAMAKREILSAAEHFSQIRACRKSNLNGSMAPGPPTNVPGQVTIQVRVPYRVVGLVVGPKGATIKRIQQQTHTYIVTPSRDKEPVFEVTGLPDAVDQARKEVEAHIAMRTGGLLDSEEANTAAAVAAVAAAAAVNRPHEFGSHSIEDLFGSSSSDLVSSLYKLNGSAQTLANGLSGSGSSLSALSGLGNGLPNGLSNGLHNGMNSGLSNGLHNGMSGMNAMNALNSSSGLAAMPAIHDMNYILGDATHSLLGATKDSSLFANSGMGGPKTSLNSNSMGAFYNADEGLGSLGSSMGSSPALEPPSSIWGSSGFSSALSSLTSVTRRSSSVSGASPPPVPSSDRLSPSATAIVDLTQSHAPMRRVSSEPSSTGVGASPSSSPDLGLAVSSGRSSPSLGIPDKRCRRCGAGSVTAAVVPCGHNLFCMDCAESLVHEGARCSVCLETVKQAIRILS